MARARALTPSGLDTPALMMNFPFTVCNAVRNNVLMVHNREYDYDRAYAQWMGLYKSLAEHALIYVMPHNGTKLQDLPFTANMGAYLPHCDMVVMSNFRSEPRQGEEDVGAPFFLNLGYQVTHPPCHFEGEADLKFIRHNTYIGGYGIRTASAAYKWMEALYGAYVEPIPMTDEKLYHFDCIFFPLDDRRALVATSVLSKESVKRIERHVDIIAVPAEYAYDDWTNAVRVGEKVYVKKPPNDESLRAADDLLARAGYELVPIDLSEFELSGAALSCFVFHMNFHGRI